MPLFKVRSLFCQFRLLITVILISGFVHSGFAFILQWNWNIFIFFVYWHALKLLELDRYCKNHMLLSLWKLGWCLLKEELSEWSESCSEVLLFVCLFVLRSHMPVNAGFTLENSSFLNVHTGNLPYLNFALQKVERWLHVFQVMWYLLQFWPQLSKAQGRIFNMLEIPEHINCD